MYRVVSVSAAGDPEIDDVADATAALELGRQLIAAGHTEIMITTPDGRAFLFSEYLALMGAGDKPSGD